MRRVGVGGESAGGQRSSCFQTGIAIELQCQKGKSNSEIYVRLVEGADIFTNMTCQPLEIPIPMYWNEIYGTITASCEEVCCISPGQRYQFEGGWAREHQDVLLEQRKSGPGKSYSESIDVQFQHLQIFAISTISPRGSCSSETKVACYLRNVW